MFTGLSFKSEVANKLPEKLFSGKSGNVQCLSGRCRVKAYHQRSAQYDQILKKNEQMYALLAITTSLCPASQRNVDESVANTLKEK